MRRSVCFWVFNPLVWESSFTTVFAEMILVLMDDFAFFCHAMSFRYVVNGWPRLLLHTISNGTVTCSRWLFCRLSHAVPLSLKRGIPSVEDMVESVGLKPDISERTG